jgi:hypothetical protein
MGMLTRLLRFQFECSSNFRTQASSITTLQRRSLRRQREKTENRCPCLRERLRFADWASRGHAELNELSAYVSEAKAIIQILWGLLLIMVITLVFVSILYVLLRVKVRTYRKREAQLARHISSKSDDIARLEEKLAQYIEMEDGVEDLKAEVRRVDAIRVKTEDRLVVQNLQLGSAQAELAAQAAELARLRKLVEHIDDL